MTISNIAIVTPAGVTVVGAPYAPAGPIVIGTSITSNDVGVGGTYTWVMQQLGLGFVPGLRVRASVTTDALTWIEGVVSSFDGVNLVVVSDLAAGVGVHNSWNVGIAGQPGQKGQKGDTGATGPTGPGGGVPADSPVFTGDPRAPTPVPGDNDNSIATTQFVQNALVNYQRFDPDLQAIAALTGIGVIYYRSAADTWSGVTIGSGLTFTAGVLSAGGMAPIDSPIFTGNPQAPTPAPGNASPSIATTGFVAASFAPLASPAFSGNPQAPTPAPGDNDTSIATTAFVQAALATGVQPLDADLTAIAALTGTNVFYYRSAANTWSPVVIGANMLFSGGTLSATGTTGGGGVPADSPVFTGDPQAPTPPPGDNDASIATTSFVQLELSAYAKLANPSFSGNPQAPTPTAGDNDTSIATTAFVQNAIAGKADTAALAAYAPLASPVFTGDPQAPTPAAGDNDTSIATTAFVQGILASPTFTGDPKAPTPVTADNDTSIATTAHVKAVVASYAPLASPTFTGTPAAPTPTPSTDNSTRLATTAFVQSVAAAAGSATGVTDGSSAAAGKVGEEIILRRDYSTRLGMSTAAYNNMGSITVPAGEWELSFNCGYHAEAAPAGNALQASLSVNTTGAGDPDSQIGGPLFCGGMIFAAGIVTMASAVYTVRLTSSRVYYMLMWHNLGAATPTYGTYFIRARRVR